MNRRTARHLALAVLLPLLTTLAACGASGNVQTDADGKPNELRIAYQEIPGGDLIVKHEGWLEDKLGIDVRWRRFDSGAAVNQALEQGTVDMGLIGSSGTALGIGAGADYKVIWIHDVIGAAESLVARKATSLKQLVNKTVATPFGSTAHYSLLAALDREGVDINRIDIVDLQPDQIKAAWKAGTIDAAYVWQPTLGALLKDGGSMLLSGEQLRQEGLDTYDLAVASEELVADFPKLVQTWVDQQARANQMMQDEPDRAAKIIGAELDISADQAGKEMTGYAYPSASDQAGGRYLGGTKGLATQLAQAAKFLKDYPQAAKFLKEQGALLPVPTAKDYANSIDASFVKGAKP